MPLTLMKMFGVFYFSFSRCHWQTPQASSLSDAKGPVITAYFLVPNNLPLYHVSKILSGIAGFLRI